MAEPLLPYALSFAAGAMVFVVLDDLVPESNQWSVQTLSLSLSLSLCAIGSCIHVYICIIEMLSSLWRLKCTTNTIEKGPESVLYREVFFYCVLYLECRYLYTTTL